MSGRKRDNNGSNAELSNVAIDNASSVDNVDNVDSFNSPGSFVQYTGTDQHTMSSAGPVKNLVYTSHPTSTEPEYAGGQ